MSSTVLLTRLAIDTFEGVFKEAPMSCVPCVCGILVSSRFDGGSWASAQSWWTRADELYHVAVCVGCGDEVVDSHEFSGQSASSAMVEAVRFYNGDGRGSRCAHSV